MGVLPDLWLWSRQKWRLLSLSCSSLLPCAHPSSRGYVLLSLRDCPLTQLHQDGTCVPDRLGTSSARGLEGKESHGKNSKLLRSGTISACTTQPQRRTFDLTQPSAETSLKLSGSGLPQFCAKVAHGVQQPCGSFRNIRRSLSLLFFHHKY